MLFVLEKHSYTHSQTHSGPSLQARRKKQGMGNFGGGGRGGKDIDPEDLHTSLATNEGGIGKGTRNPTNPCQKGSRTDEISLY